MKNITRGLTMVLGSIIWVNSYAMPNAINEIVHADDASCGGDACYISMSLEKVDNVSITAFCSDKVYCPKYIDQLEKSDKESIQIDRRAKVELSLVDNPYSGQKMYSLNKMTFLKD